MSIFNLEKLDLRCIRLYLNFIYKVLYSRFFIVITIFTFL